jgi:hypothetical protein
MVKAHNKQTAITGNTKRRIAINPLPWVLLPRWYSSRALSHLEVMLEE